VLHFDGCVNHGVTRANKFLQEAVGVEADGVLGPMSLEAINSSDPFETCKGICDNREEFYNAIVERKPAQSRFLNGWLRRINEIEGFTINPTEDFT
jgi:lysozyme family protein